MRRPVRPACLLQARVPRGIVVGRRVMIAGRDEHRRAARHRERTHCKGERAGVDRHPVEQVARHQDGVHVMFDGVLDHLFQGVLLIATPQVTPVGRQPRERAAQVQVGDLQEARERHEVTSLSQMESEPDPCRIPWQGESPKVTAPERVGQSGRSLGGDSRRGRGPARHRPSLTSTLGSVESSGRLWCRTRWTGWEVATRDAGRPCPPGWRHPGGRRVTTSPACPSAADTPAERAARHRAQRASAPAIRPHVAAAAVHSRCAASWPRQPCWR